MTSWVEGNRSFFIGAPATLIGADDRETASWASPHIQHNPAYKWVLGRFVEADRANNNRQLFSLEGLQIARPTIAHAPMNMSHDTRRVVGAYVAAELLYPTGGAATAAVEGENGPFPCPGCGSPIDDNELPDDIEDTTCPKCGQTFPPRGYVNSGEAKMTGGLEVADAGDAGLNPYIEALGVFWRHYFPEEYQLVQVAHAQGRLFFSMECVPAQIQCTGKGGCGSQFEYAGRQSPTYCDHLNKSTSDKYLIDPHFTAGAMLVPPIQPGWSRADVHSLVAEHSEFAERLYDSIAVSQSHLEKSVWESTMAELLVLANR